MSRRDGGHTTRFMGEEDLGASTSARGVAHAQYTRLEILAVFGIDEGTKVAPWQTGVYSAKSAKAELAVFTLISECGLGWP